MSTPSGADFGGSYAQKICVVCGDDVGSKPRTKDSKGRYYCAACYEHALAEKHAKRQAMPLPKVAPPGSGEARPAPRSSSRANPAPAPPPVIADVDANMLDHLLDIEPAHAAPPMVCPACRSSVPAGGVLCTMCGHNMQTGAALAPAKVRVAKPSGSIWPIIVGGVSVAFGAVGAILYGLNLIGTIMGISADQQHTASFHIGRLGGATLVLSLAIWLLIAGIGVILKRSSAAASIHRWAIAKLVVVGACMLPIALLLAMSLVKVRDSGRLPPEFEDIGDDLVAITFGLLAVQAFWPIFVLVWFNRAQIKTDIDEWA